MWPLEEEADTDAVCRLCGALVGHGLGYVETEAGKDGLLACLLSRAANLE